MRCSHGGAVETLIVVVTGVVRRTSGGARRGDLRLKALTAIRRDWATATKGSNRIGPRVQSAYSVSSFVNGRWPFQPGTGLAAIARGYYHLNAGSALRFHRLLQRARSASVAIRTGPGVVSNIRSLSRITLRRGAADRVRGQKKFHALHVCRGAPEPSIHVSTADELGAGRDTDLICPAVVTYDRADGVRAVPMIVARLRIIRATHAGAGVNAIMPVEVMIRG